MEISHCTYLSFIDLHHHLILRLQPLVRLTYTSNKNYKLYNGRSRCFNGCVINKYRITLGNTELQQGLFTMELFAERRRRLLAYGRLLCNFF